MKLRAAHPVASRIRPSFSSGALRARRKFLHFFPEGFSDPKYIAWERGYKWKAHTEWNQTLGKAEFEKLLTGRQYSEIGARAVRLESRTNLLFSFEKMALRDAVKTAEGTRLFSKGLYEFIYGTGSSRSRFESWLAAVASLPRKQTRVVTWPIVTVFGFLARPDLQIFLKPTVTKEAAGEYGFSFNYVSRPSWECYASLLDFGQTIKTDLADLKPQDLIDIQSFIWVQGSSEYDD